jgi:uncharacterized MAPEG superfamily protein
MNIDALVAQIGAAFGPLATLPFVNMQITGLSVELTMLVFAVILGVLQLWIAARTVNSSRGLKWNLSARDGEPPAASAIGLRLDRAFRNFMETFPFFAATVLILAVAQRSNWASLAGTQLYFAARVLYVPLYAGGVVGVRTFVWLIAMLGLVLTIAAVFLGPEW